MLLNTSVMFKMDMLWISKILFLYFQCLDISSILEAGFVTTIQHPEENTINISCWNTSRVQIQNIGVQEEETACPCILNVNDKRTIEDTCNGENSCLVDYKFTSSCLREYRYINVSYLCKHDNGTDISTFEDDFGDWTAVLSNKEWQLEKNIKDHTRVNLAKFGGTITAISWGGSATTARTYTSNEFVGPICLSLWYQFYVHSYDCNLSIFKITDKNHTLLFTVDSNSSLLNTWINISVNVYGKDPFKIALEADFMHRDSTVVRSISIDDTSIAKRPCKGQQVYRACHDLKEPVEIECEKQYLISEIDLLFEPKHLTSHLKNCPAESIKNEINSFCRNLNKTDKCKFSVFNFTSGYEDCYISSKNMSVSYQCSDESQTTTLDGMLTESSTIFKAGIPVIIVSTLVFLMVAVVVIIVIFCNRKKRAKNSKLCKTPQNTIATEMIDSSDYNVIDYDEMKDIHNRNENRNQTHSPENQPQNSKTPIEQDKNICNKYEALSTKRTSIEHIYESDSIHTNQYESLTKQQELDKHTYESTEQALPQHMKTSNEQDENICNRYESLSTNRNPAEHMYELDSIPINHYQSLKKQQELDEHTYESTEHASQVSMNQELSQYESLTHPSESEKHVYAST